MIARHPYIKHLQKPFAKGRSQGEPERQGNQIMTTGFEMP